MYNFGQFRRTQLDSYMTALNYDFIDLETQSPLSQGVVFLDKAITLSEQNVLQATDDTGTAVKSYYMRFKIYKKEDSEQLVTIKLVNTNKTEDNQQTIKTVKIESGLENDYSTFDIVIAPNATYNNIQFILNRVVDDYNTVDENNIYGRKMNINIDSLKEIYNVIETLNPSIDNLGRLKQIGVQSAPGLMMSIEGELIRVGRSGIYEINNGVSIKYIGFIVEPNDNKYFVLDYQY